MPLWRPKLWADMLLGLPLYRSLVLHDVTDKLFSSLPSVTDDEEFVELVQ